MTVTTSKYAPVCEQPGCDRRLTVEGRTMWSDPGDYELDALRTYWQHDGDGRWYCPKHWHLTCRHCGRTAVGDPDRLADAGWEADFWAGHTCPYCTGTH